MREGSKSAGIFARLAGKLRSASAGDPLRQTPTTASAAAESPRVPAAPAAPQASAAELINEGLRQRQQLGTAAAVPFFERAAARGTPSHLPFFMLGNAATELGDLDAAVAHYSRARDLAPHDHVIHYNLGLCHFWRGFMDPAIEELDAACRLNPSYLPARTSYLLALHNSDRIEPKDIATAIRQLGAQYPAAPQAPSHGAAEPRPCQENCASASSPATFARTQSLISSSRS